MQILFLDDEKNRVDTLIKNTGLPIYWANNRVRFETAVRTQSWDLICFDHDLGEFAEVFAYSGEVAAKWLRDNLNLVSAEQRLVVHSANPVGAMNICSVLKDIPGAKINKIPYFWNRVSYSKEKGLVIH